MRDVACVVHCHSLHSDGTGTVPEIARAARRAGVEAVLLTDHDTLAARERGEDGWQQGVLIVCGHEVTARVGHLLAFGLDRVVAHRGVDARTIAERVREGGGLGVAAHPWSRGNPRIGRKAKGNPFGALDAVDAVELWSAVTDSAEQVRSIREVSRLVVAPDHWLAHPPPGRLAAYDALTRTRRVVAVGGLDAHQIGVRVGGRVPLRLMGYRRTFRLLRTRVLLDDRVELGERSLLSALAAGHCYLARDSLSCARGTRVEALGADGSVRATMGDEIPLADVARIRLRLPHAASASIWRDGAPLVGAEGRELEVAVDRPGVYRAEARLRRHGRERTWVLANPVYVR